jgi:hypothetical protein
MELDKLIKEIKEKGFVSTRWLMLRGGTKPVCNFIDLMANTVMYSPDKEQCQYLTQQNGRDGGATW